mgnify:CR=1 FL=1
MGIMSRKFLKIIRINKYYRMIILEKVWELLDIIERDKISWFLGECGLIIKRES